MTPVLPAVRFHLRELGLLLRRQQGGELGLEALVEGLELGLGLVGRQRLLADLGGVRVGAVRQALELLVLLPALRHQRRRLGPELLVERLDLGLLIGRQVESRGEVSLHRGHVMHAGLAVRMGLGEGGARDEQGGAEGGNESLLGVHFGVFLLFETRRHRRGS
jgi:hypothetical protein